MQTVLITGGTGMVGRALTALLLEKGYKVIILTRSLPKTPAHDGCRYALWDVSHQQIDVQALQEADHIVHLAGAGVVEKKWTAAYKNEIVSSRVNSSELLINTLKVHSNSIKTIVSASAIGWYGADPAPEQDGFTENDPPEQSFLGDTCRQWEESIAPVTALGKRLVKLRIGIVLSSDGGALAEFKKPVGLGIAAILGSGKQVVSWIHIEDLCRLFIYAIEHETLQGSFNAVAPEPVSNKKLVIELARDIRGKFYMPLHVPAFILKLMMGQRSIEILKSARVNCKKIKGEGFIFLYPSIEAALENLVKK